MPGTATPDRERVHAYLRELHDRLMVQGVKDVQAPSAQAVTGGHGECCCSECETGWAAAWAAWVGR